ncbi:MAG: TetR/AcrR family transcriptional regulator [Aeromicrobium sp.]
MSDDTESGAAGRLYGGVTATERRARRRADLVDAALDLIAEAGPNAVTKRAVCGRAGLNDRYFYEHFANSEALLLALMQDTTAQGVELLLAAVAAAGPTVPAQVLAAAHALLDFVSEDPRRATLLLASHGNETLQRAHLETQQTVARIVAVMARQVLGDAAPTEQNTEMASFVVVSGGMELLSAWIRGEYDVSREQLARLLAALLLAYAGADYDQFAQ